MSKRRDWGRDKHVDMPEVGVIIPWDVLDATEVDPRAIAVEVVLRAMDDATNEVVRGNGEHAERPRRQEKQNAIAFCTARHGDWAKARIAWCDAAGINPDSLRAHVLGKLAEARGGV